MSFFGGFDRKIDGPGLPGGFIIYQGNPSICLKRTPMTMTFHRLFHEPMSLALSARDLGGNATACIRLGRCLVVGAVCVDASRVWVHLEHVFRIEFFPYAFRACSDLFGSLAQIV